MKPADARLVHHLVIAIALKLLVLTALWWAFVRSDRVSVGPERAALHLGLPALAATPPAPVSGVQP